jgi:phosphatidylglycerophosphate synthase
MVDLSNRRPLASRQTGWAAQVTRWLAGTTVTPNQISIAGMVAAAGAGAAFWSAGGVAGWGRALLLVLAAGLCQLRLLCNLFDGLVAVEGGLGSPDGAFWNEVPDRLSDLVILAGFGAAAGSPMLGLLAGALALFTAYLREFGRAAGLGSDFSGPGAKSHRMAVVIGGALAQVLALILGLGWPVVTWALWLVIALTAITVARRSLRILHKLGAAG